MWALRYLSIVLPLVLLARLAQQGLWKVRPYNSLALFLLVGFARDLWLLSPAYDSHEYTVVWEWTLPALLIAQIMAGAFTYGAISQLYTKIGTFAVKLFAACLVIVCVFGLVVLPVEVRRIGNIEAQVRILFLLQRWVAALLGGGLVLAVLFLARFPRPLRKLPKNILVHTVCIAVYFTSYASLYALENIRALGTARLAVEIQLGIVCACYVGWTLGLSKAGLAGEAWEPLDPAVTQMLNNRYNRALEWLRHTAEGEGRK